MIIWNLLKKHFEPENVALKCEANAESTSEVVVRTTMLAKPQDVLIVTLKRFLYLSVEKSTKKISNPVSVPHSLSMWDFTSPKQKTEYDLLAAIDYYGTIDQGHNVASVKINSRWFKFNDKNVSEYKSSHEMKSNKNHYILVYRLKK